MGETRSTTAATAASGPASSRFRSVYDDQALPRAVAEIARHVDVVDPASVSQRQWDRARAPAGHPRAPAARQAAARLGFSWPELLARALTRNAEQLVGARQGAEDEEWLTPDGVAGYVRAIALGLGAKTLRPHEYVQRRAELVAASRRRYRHGAALFIPTQGQVEYVAGSWDRALELAGLKALSHLAPRQRGVDLLDTYELHLALHGCLPPYPDLERFAKAERFSLQGRRGRLVVDLLAALRTQRQDRGLWTPPAYPPSDDRPSYSEPCMKDPASAAQLDEVLASVETTSVRSRKRRVEEGDCERAMEAFIDQLPGDKNPTERAYSAFLRAHPDEQYPWPGSFRRHGGFQRIKERVQKRRQQR